MMLMGVFAAATTLVVASTEIDGIGATNLPTTPKVAFLEPKPEVTKINRCIHCNAGYPEGHIL